MSNLIGLHDREAVAIAAPDSWIVDTLALSERPAPQHYDPRFNWIARLNWGYGSTGTIPLPAHYPAMAERAAQYVSRSSGCRRWIIGNEPSLKREWPDNQPVFPWHYAACYKLCRQAIHALPGHQYDDVLIAGSGPWNAELKYEGNPDGDWIKYFSDVLELCTPAIDGFAIHAYTHGYDPALVISTDRMDSPFHNRFYNFLCYRDYCDAIPTDLHHLPVYITEANGDGPWQATGLMGAMLDEIDKWNWGVNKPKISCVVFYRWPKYDQYYIDGRADVIAEYNGAAAAGYESPSLDPPQRPIEPPDPEEPPPWEPQPTPPAVPGGGPIIDPALAVRGVTFDFVSPPAGTGYWRIIYAQWLDENEADAAGPDHHILGKTLRDGVEVAGVPLYVTWPSGNATVTSKGDDPNASYNYDYPMSPSLNEFDICVNDGSPSDKASGIGMGAYDNPGIHTSTWIDFAWTIAEGEQPTPIHPHTEYVVPVQGANLRDEPGQHGEVLIAVPYREAVSVSGLAEDPAGDLWASVRYQSYDGFIRSDLLSLVQPDAIVEPEPPSSVAGKLIWPVRGARISQRFGERYEYYQEQFQAAGHNGIDFALPAGEPIFATADGVVDVVAEDRPGYGLYCRIFHPAIRLGSLYAHCSEILVAEGQRVTQGQQIARVGSTGNSTGPHLHYELCAQEVSGGYVNVSYGHTRGRANPEIIHWLLGMPPVYA